MKREGIQNMQDSLCIILNHMLFVAAVITIADLFQADSPNVLLWSLVVVVPLGVCYLTKIIPKVIPPPIVIVLLVIFSLLEKIKSTHDFSMYYYVITFAYLIGCFVFYFIKRFLNFLKLNENTASKIPIQDIFQNGMGMTVVFSIGSAIILALTMNFDWVKAIADRIWNGILWFLRYILSGIETKPPVEGNEELMEKDPQLGGASMSEVIPEQTLEDIRNLMIILFAIAIIIGFILFLYYIYYVIKDLEGLETRKKKDKKLTANDDVREYCGIEKKVKKKAGGSVFRSNREKIRRLYQKKLLKRKKELIGEQTPQLLKYLTAKECCDKLSEQQLKLAYEKARYSDEVITLEDVRMAK